MYKSRNNILIVIISFTTTFITLLFLRGIEKDYRIWSRNLLNTSVSDIEIMTTNYYNLKHLQPNKYYLYNYPDYLKILKTVVDEDYLAQVLKYNGYIVSPKYEYKVLVNGIEPEKYKLLFTNVNNIKSGKYLSDRYSSIVGKTLAEKLKLKVGDRFIIRLLDVNNLYKAEEFKVSGIFESKNYLADSESIFVNIDVLNDLIAEKHALSSIHIKSRNKNVYNTLRKLFSDDIGLYTKYDINNLFSLNENKIMSIKRYIYLFFSMVIFTLYFHINAKAFTIYYSFDSSIIKNIVYAFVGFLFASLIPIFKRLDNTDFTILFILNILLLLLSGIIPYIYTKKRVIK